MVNTDSEIRDVAIIGAGPVGLFAIFQCGMLGLSTHVFDSLPEIGGQCSALYPEKPIYDIPAAPSIFAGDLIERLEEQAAPFNPIYHLNQVVTSISYNNCLWRLCSEGAVDVYARTIIIAAGAGCFGPNRPPLSGIEDYEGKSVFYMVKRKSDFAGKDIVIAGGGDSAIDWALSLAPLAKSLKIVHRRAKFRAAPESVRQMEEYVQAGKIECVTPYQLSSLQGQDGVLNGVVVRDLDGQEKTLSADLLLPFFGLATELGPVAQWGLDIDRHTITVDPTTCQTNIDNIYAIGDIVSYKHKLKLILTGFAEAAQAAHAIYNRIHPDTPLHFEYSTTKGLPPIA